MKRKLTGTVVSDKMQGTAVVAVEHLRKHARYEKFYKVTRRLKAQNDNNTYHTGEKVIIEETRPLSKEKRWRIISKI